MHLHNRQNEYAAELGELLDKCPKAVVAAIAVSVLTVGGDRLEIAKERFAEEWEALFANGIVPQKPPKIVREILKAADRKEGLC